ncbi:hypothetical protein C0J52_21806 [Blattella germanica]|nr:hypothetical protein C0J52_21806 [Blattella germanica]
MGINPTGTLQGTAQGLRLLIDLSADLESFKTTLGGLNVINAAKINIEVHGNGVADEIVNAIAGLVEPYFEQEILSFVEEKMRTTMAETLVDFDIHEIIG